MKPLICILSCQRDQENKRNDTVRRTWGQNSVIPFKFFVGGPSTQPDEISLNCSDAYFSLPVKLQLALKWALAHDYTHIFKADTDTFIYTDRLLNAIPSEDYVGHLYKDAYNETCDIGGKITRTFFKPFLHGGPGYWLSLKAAKYIVQADASGDFWEDYWVGSVLRQHDILGIHDNRYSFGEVLNEDVITIHPLDKPRKS